jgi:hypothetical protein
MHTVFAGTYLVMCVIEAVQTTSIPDYTRRRHPPAIFRYFAAFSTATNVLKRMINKGLSIDYQAILDAQARVVRAIELAMTDRVGLTPDPDLIQQAIDRSKKHDLEVYGRWAEIRPVLQKTKLGNHQLAPAQYGPDGVRLRPGPYDGLEKL